MVLIIGNVDRRLAARNAATMVLVMKANLAAQVVTCDERARNLDSRE